MALRAWNQGWPIAVYQFVKSAKWKVGEENALTALGRLHQETGEGGPVVWHKMGSGWSWSRRAGTEVDRKSTRLNSSHANISYAVFCLKKTNTKNRLHKHTEHKS